MMERSTQSTWLHLAVFCLTLFLGLQPSDSYAQVVNNGSITGSPAANSGINAGNAPGWSGCSFSPDLCSVTFASYTGNSQVPRVASPDGGTWLGVAALGECAQTTITGLTVGNSYTLYFCGANFGTGALYNAANVTINVTVGATIATFNIPQVANTWNPYSMNFTANAATMTLRVQAPSGSNGYGSIDGFNLTGSICNPVILPSTLESFSGALVDCQARLDWEIPNDYVVEKFEIERSQDGEHFEKVGMVPSQPSSQANYRFTDPQPLPQGSYRLRIFHADGHVAESKAVQVEGNCQGSGIQVLPNPVAAGAIAHVRYYAGSRSTRFVVTNVNGQVMRTVETDSEIGAWNELELDTQNWGAGLYLIQGSNGGTAKLILQ